MINDVRFRCYESDNPFMTNHCNYLYTEKTKHFKNLIVSQKVRLS